MSVRRSRIAALGLAVLLLAAGAAQVQSSPPPAPVGGSGYIYYLPNVANNFVILTGTVTNNTAPASGETVRLMVSRNGGASFSEEAQAVTNASGGYQFTSSFQSTSDLFYAAWKNSTTGGGGKLWNFNCNKQAYTTTNRTCNINIHDVPLLDPTPGQWIHFPYTFRWTPRSTTDDYYAVTIWNDDALKTLRAVSDYVSYTDRVTISVAPPNSVVGERYYWSVRVHTTYGEGDAYWLNPLYYWDRNSAALDSGPGWVEESGTVVENAGRIK